MSTEHTSGWTLPFSLGDHGLAPAEREETLSGYRKYIEQQSKSFLGYQANQHASYSKQLSWMLDHHVNNIGDPFTEGNFTINSKAFERDVLDYFAELWHATVPHRPDDGDSYWGYVLTMGSTEGNLYGLWNARDYLRGRALILDPANPMRMLWVEATMPSEAGGVESSGEDDLEDGVFRTDNAFTPVAFYSADTHYSLTKAVRVLDIPTPREIGNKRYRGKCPLGGPWPDEVPSLRGDGGPGSIDVDALCQLVEFFASNGHPALVSLNAGTTFKGAYDPVAEIAPRIVKIMKDHGLYQRTVYLPNGMATERHGFWIHVDGALGAAYLPYLREAQRAGDPRVKHLPPIPEFDFAIEHVFSMAMSGHKWIGAPWPCGIYMTKTKYQLEPPDIPAYIGSPDTTFAGSRGGFSSVVLWEHLARYSHTEQVDRVIAAEQLTEYATDKLIELGKTHQIDLKVARTPLALTVRFRKPVDHLVFKYSLSTETFLSDPSFDYAHLFVMPGVIKELIDRLVDDLSQPGAFDEPAQPTFRAALAAEAIGTASTAPLFTAAKTVPLVGRGFH